MKLLVIVVTYNGMKWLDKCLSSVVDSSVKADLFIVDNGSTDGSIDFIKGNYPEAIFIESKENLGFGSANNIGLKYALDNDYDYVYLLNQDAWVEPDTFEKLITVSQDNSEYGILSPLQVNKDNKALDKDFLYNCPKEIISDLLVNQLKPIYEMQFVMAAHWLIQCRIIQKVGGFSPTFSHYGEDENYIHRIFYWGYKVGIVPTTIGVHDREYRIITNEKKRYLSYCKGLVIISNPNTKHRLLKLFKLYLSFFYYDRSLTSIRYFYKIVLSLRKISYNRKYSIVGGAFL